MAWRSPLVRPPAFEPLSGPQISGILNSELATTYPNDSRWRHYPWLLGLLLAPLLFGSVNPDGQAVVGFFFATSLLLLGGQTAGSHDSGWWWIWLCAGLLVLPLLPLPTSIVALISPHRVALDRAFPVEIGHPAAWLTLTISPAGTVQRLWELSLLIAGFSLARIAAQSEKFPHLLALMLGLGLALLAASDVWYRLDGQRSVLGWWQISWGKGAGTFANRNHFADWIYVAFTFVLGWIVRQQFPLQSARLRPLVRPVRVAGEAICLGLALTFGLVMAVASGSRGGFLALVVGLVVWVVLLIRRSKRRKRWLGVAAAGVVLLGLVWLAGGTLFYRFTEMQEDAPVQFIKLNIWKQSFQQLLLRFPLFGTGWGSFVVAFNHFKTSGGDSTVWHAENEYLQLLVETGVIGFIAFGGVGFQLARRAAQSAWQDCLAEPEMFFGAVAALAVFAAHAAVEFVFQITATALLAAVLLGFLTGGRERTARPALPSPLPRWRRTLNAFGAVALLAAAGAQGLACFHAHQAATARSPELKVAALSHALRYWPWATDRSIELTRAQVAQLATLPRSQWTALAQTVRNELSPAITRDPYQWELRLERAALDLNFLTNRVRAVAEVHEVIRLNPLQPRIPLAFARLSAERDPELAWEFLRATDLSGGRHLREALDLAWQIRGDTPSLRAVAPDTAAGGIALGDFALEKGFFPLAAQSFLRLTNRVEPLLLAERLIAAGRPDLAIAVLPQSPAFTADRLVMARAQFEMKAYRQAISYAEAVWLGSRAKNRIVEPAPSEPPGFRPAEEMFRLPAEQRNLPQLRQWAEQNPFELRLLWLVFQTELARDQFSAAARTAIELASRVAARK